MTSLVTTNVPSLLRENRTRPRCGANHHLDGLSSCPSIVKEFQLVDSLDGHTGCVNALCWSANGEILVSGSDDTHICIWDARDDRMQLAYVVHTGHHQNIFNVKLLPYPNDYILVSCAADSEIRVFDLRKLVGSTHPFTASGHTTIVSETRDPDNRNITVIDGSRYLIRKCICHRRSVKRISTISDAPFEFLSCGQDGRVLRHDLREPHRCVSSIINSRLNPNVLVDYSRFQIEFHSISVNKFLPHLFAIGGSAEPIFLHDRRMIPNEPASGDRARSWSGRTRCVARFLPLDIPETPEPSSFTLFGSKHPTAVKFASSNSCDLIGSWSMDHIYLFNIRNSLVQSYPTKDLVSHTTPSEDANKKGRPTGISFEASQQQQRKRSNASHTTSTSSADSEKHVSRRRVRRRADTSSSGNGSSNGNVSDSGSFRLSVFLPGGSHASSTPNNRARESGPFDDHNDAAAFLRSSSPSSSSSLDALNLLETYQWHALKSHQNMAEREFHRENYHEALECLTMAIRQISDGSEHSTAATAATTTNSSHSSGNSQSDDESAPRSVGRSSFADHRNAVQQKRQSKLHRLRCVLYTNRAVTYVHLIARDWLASHRLAPFMRGVHQCAGNPTDAERGANGNGSASPLSMFSAIERDIRIARENNPHNARTLALSALTTWLMSYNYLYQALASLCEVIGLSADAARSNVGDYNIHLGNFESEHGSVAQYLLSVGSRAEELLESAKQDANASERELRVAMHELNEFVPAASELSPVTASPGEVNDGRSRASPATPELSSNHADFGVSSEAFAIDLLRGITALKNTIDGCISNVRQHLRIGLGALSAQNTLASTSSELVQPANEIERAAVIVKEILRMGYFAGTRPPLEACGDGGESPPSSNRVDKVLACCFIQDRGDHTDGNLPGGAEQDLALVSIDDAVSTSADKSAWFYLTMWDANPVLLFESAIITPTSTSSSSTTSNQAQTAQGSPGNEGECLHHDHGHEPGDSRHGRSEASADSTSEIGDFMDIEPIRIGPSGVFVEGDEYDEDEEEVDEEDTSTGGSLLSFSDILLNNGSMLYTEDGYTDSENSSQPSFRRGTAAATTTRPFAASRVNRRFCEASAPLGHEVACYKGHCNIQTLKDVNFYGPRDEYIVSGSDDGNWFIWDKKTAKIVQVLQGDSQVVNVVEARPHRPMVAVSGIDSTVQIFSVSAQGPSWYHQQRYPLQRYLERRARRRDGQDEGGALGRPLSGGYRGGGEGGDNDDFWDWGSIDDYSYGLGFSHRRARQSSGVRYSGEHQTDDDMPDSPPPFNYQSQSLMPRIDEITRFNQELYWQHTHETQVTAGFARILRQAGLLGGEGRGGDLSDDGEDGRSDTSNTTSNQESSDEEYMEMLRLLYNGDVDDNDNYSEGTTDS